MHVGELDRIAFDAAARVLLTTSADKSARLWSTQDGRLRAVLRPPADLRSAGKITAAALSPDGREAAVAFTSSASNLFVYSADGALRMAAQVSGEIRSLKYAPEGQWLLASSSTGLWRLDAKTLSATRITTLAPYNLAVAGGVVVFVTDGKDSNQDIQVCRVDMAAPCRVVAETPKAYIMAEYGQPRLSPDGRRLSYGIRHFYRGQPDNVRPYAEVRDVATGEVIVRKEGGLGEALWDNLGNAYTVTGGKLRRLDLQSAMPGAAVLDVAGTPRGAVVVDGRLWYVRPSGRQMELVRADVGDSSARTVAVVARTPEEDSNAKAFNYASLSERDVRFPERARPTGCYYIQLEDPATPARLKDAANCQNTLVLPDGGMVYSRYNELRRYAPDGSVTWRTSYVGNIPMGISQSLDGRWIGVRAEDGTLRLMHAQTGKEVLAVYEQDNRWVMATPTGYYDASPAGEELIGWQVNRGASEAPDFFPASRFRAQLNRPDVVAKILETGDEASAVQQANADAGRKPPSTSVTQVLPPVVEIVSGASATASASPLVVKYTLRSPADAPVTAVRVRVNGQALDLPESRNLVATAANAAREISIPIPAQDSEVQVFAQNRNGVSTPATVRVSWKGAPPKQQDAFEAKPKLYVLAVGVSDYDNPQYKLGLAAKDAQDFAAALMKQKGALYRDVEVKLLTNKGATQGEVLDGLEWLRKQVTARDVGMLFLAGHGYNDADGVYYFMPVNADLDRLKRTGVVFTEIKNTLSNLAGKALFFVDTCHSGNVLGGGRRAIPQDVTGIINELSSAENGVVVFSSSTGRQFSLEDPAWGNGAFTKALVEGINGKADMNKNGRITHKMLDFYLSERVKELTKGQQTPVTQAPGGVPDFPIAITR